MSNTSPPGDPPPIDLAPARSLIQFGGGPQPTPEIQSARSQASTANFIVGGLVLIAALCIGCAYLFAMDLSKATGGDVALIGGAITGLISIISAAVGGLVNSLVAPSGVAAVVAAAQKDGQAQH